MFYHFFYLEKDVINPEAMLRSLPILYPQLGNPARNRLFFLELLAAIFLNHLSC